MAQQFAARVTAASLLQLAGDLSLTAGSLQRLMVGWNGHAWTFPMLGADGSVCGIRLRLPSGQKLSVAGGREGLFVPSDLTVGGPLYVAEGPTDTAALLDIGLDAIGRPSCTGGVKLTVEHVKATGRREIVIVADGDGPGQRGAATLAAVLAAYSSTIRVITPPVAVKDAREWVRLGATRADVQSLASTVSAVRLGLTIRRIDRVA